MNFNLVHQEGMRVLLYINGSFEGGTEYQVQPFMSLEAFLSGASQKLNLSSVATLA